MAKPRFGADSVGLAFVERAGLGGLDSGTASSG
ncbi:hypothetical protein J3R03_005183 [Actinoplanes couchii]|nr:hypothetical protein [Actinoplanes couchii]